MNVTQPSDSIPIHPPLQGIWKILRPPGHHPYALDFIQLGQERNSPHNTAALRFYVHRIPAPSFYCWNKPVYSPVTGTVIRVGTGWKDHASTNIWKTIWRWYKATFCFRPVELDGVLDIRPNVGNYLMIQTEEGYIVFMAHLRDQSIQVSEGSQVQRGDLIGRVGNSGNTTMPHLHLNLFDQMTDPFSAKVLPFVFTQYEQLSDDGHWLQSGPGLPEPGMSVRFVSITPGK